MAQRQEDFGALVGWTARGAGGRLALRLECVNSPPPHDEGDIQAHYIALDANQAVQLGNFLFEMAGRSKPAPRPGWLARLFMR